MFSKPVGSEQVCGGPVAASCLLWGFSVPSSQQPRPSAFTMASQSRCREGTWLSSTGQVNHKTGVLVAILINLDVMLVKLVPRHPGFMAGLQVGNTMPLGCRGPLPLPRPPLHPCCLFDPRLLLSSGRQTPFLPQASVFCETEGIPVKV